VMYGPVVLAGALGTEAMTPGMQDGFGFPDVDRMVGQGAAVEIPSLVRPVAPVQEWIIPVREKLLTFRTVNAGKPRDVTLVPFFRMFHQRYAVYWNIHSEESWKALQASSKGLPEGIIDQVAVGERHSDREHNFQAYRFLTGRTGGKNWVMSPLWFRYDMNVNTAHENTLTCTYAGNGQDCTFEILIDGIRLTMQSLRGEKPGEVLEVSCPLPQALLEGKRRVAVMFRAKEGGMTGELCGLAVKSTSGK